MQHYVFWIGQALTMLEIVIVTNYIVRCLGWQKEVKHKLVRKYTLCIILFIVTQLNGLQEGSTHFVVIGVHIIMLFAFSRKYLKGRIQSQIFECLFPFMVVTVTNIFILQIFAIIKRISVGTFMDQFNEYFLVALILSKIILWFVLRIAGNIHLKEPLTLSKRYNFIINLLICYTVAMELILFYVIHQDGLSLLVSRLLITLSAGIVFTSVVIAYSIFKMSMQNKEILEYEILKTQNQQKELHIEELKRASKRMRELRHDYKNHCLGMQELLEKAEYDELRTYLQSLTGRYALHNGEFIATNNAVIDAIINTKIYQCNENGIDASCVVTGDISKADGMKCGIILFNLLDNAIEANMKVPVNDRKLEVKIARQDDMMNIVIKNAISSSVLRSGTAFQTDKLNKKLHGIGHVTVKELVDEIGGIIEYYEDEGIFHAHVLIPIE